jgi:hypothetical protein
MARKRRISASACAALPSARSAAICSSQIFGSSGWGAAAAFRLVTTASWSSDVAAPLSAADLAGAATGELAAAAAGGLAGAAADGLAGAAADGDEAAILASARDRRAPVTVTEVNWSAGTPAEPEGMAGAGDGGGGAAGAITEGVGVAGPAPERDGAFVTAPEADEAAASRAAVAGARAAAVSV